LEDPISIEKSWALWYGSVFQEMVRSLKSEEHGPGQPGQENNTLSPKSEAQKGLEAWLKHEVLSPNPCTAKKKREKSIRSNIFKFS
jgi:hypothetical protein